MSVTVGINGFGRIGRNLFRAAWERGLDVDFVAVNDITDTATLAHLTKYDSTLGPFPAKVEHSGDTISFDGKPVKVLSERDPAKLPWKELGADVVVESTGFFTDRDAASKHLEAGARKVIISAPAKGPDVTVCSRRELRRGLRPRFASHHLERLLHDQLPRAARQRPARRNRDTARVDDDHSCLHRRPASPRRAAQRPAARAGGGDQPRSDVDRGGQGDRPGRARARRQAERRRGARADRDRFGGRPRLRGRPGDTRSTRSTTSTRPPPRPIATTASSPTAKTRSSRRDISKSPYSSIFDSELTMVMDGTLVKVVSWYDNEWGYSCRLAELVGKVL